MSKDRYKLEMENFLLGYNVSIVQKKKIMNIFQKYINESINIDINKDFRNNDEESTQRIRILINEFKYKASLLLNIHGSHNIYLNFISEHKTENVNFSADDEEILYRKILENKFDIEEYCLINSDYDTMCAILHSIANKLGYGEFLRNKFKDMQSTNHKSDSFTKLRKAIKNVE